MLVKIINFVQDLGITIGYLPIHSNGKFNMIKNKPIIIINDKLNNLETALTLLHEVAHFFNNDCQKYVPNHFVNDQMEYEANRYMIQQIIQILDNEYDFRTDTNYQQIIDNLNLPYHLEGVIQDEIFALIQDKFEISSDTDWCSGYY